MGQSSEFFSECIKQAHRACRRNLISECVGTMSDTPEQDQPKRRGSPKGGVCPSLSAPH